MPFTSFGIRHDRREESAGLVRVGCEPLVALAGLLTSWTSVQKAKEGEVTIDVYGPLTCDPNVEIKRVHPKAMGVILTTTEERCLDARALGRGRGAAPLASRWCAQGPRKRREGRHRDGCLAYR